VLVRHLLNHTSGIPSYTDIGARFGRVARLDLPPDSLLAIVASDSLMFEPGTHFYYNNTGYFMLGQVIERATGTTYGRYLEQTLFKNAGLSNTFYCDTRRLIPNRAQGYDRLGSSFVNTSFLSMDLPNAAGSLCSTVGDLVSWTQQLHGGRVVNAASLAQMTTPVTLPSGRPMRYGYALTVDTVGGHALVEHGGGINGFSAYLSYAPADSLVVAVLTNTASGPSSRVTRDLLQAALGVAPVAAAAVQDLPLTPAERARYVGEYAVTQPDGTRRTSRVFEQDGKLLFAQASGTGQHMRAQGAHTFVLANGVRVVFDVAGNAATGFQWGAGTSRALEGVRAR
jgi:D-alanyl-D-alanine carboxypeptidase